MDFLFENNCTIDQKVMRESVRSNRKTFIVLSLIPLVITGLGILSILAQAVIQFQLSLPLLLRWTIFFLLFLRIATTPRRTARRVIKNFKSMYKVDSVEATTRFGDKIVYTLQGAETCTYNYDAIQKVVSAKNSYVLYFKMKVAVDSVTKGKTDYVTRKSAISLTRDGFTVGNFEEFKKFLAEKCPNVKIPE